MQWESIAERGENAAPQKKAAKKEKREGFFDVAKDKEYVRMAVWNKLFRRAFLIENNIRFPPGTRRCEDACMSIVLYASAQKCFYLNKNLYHYDLTRETSVCHNPTEEMLLETEAALKKTFAFLEEERREWCTGGGIKSFLCINSI